MNIEDAIKVVYKTIKCDEEDCVGCAHRNCKECEFFTHWTEERDARKALFEYFSKKQYINVSDDEEEKVYSE